MDLKLKGYSLLALLGEGTYGKVHLAVDNSTKNRYAMKHIPNVDKNEVSSKQTLRELYMLYSLQHRKIVNLFGIKLFENNIYIITEYCENDLRTIINDKQGSWLKNRTDSAYMIITFQILEAVRYMHAAGVIHRDIKPANILLNSNLEVKLCDFGLARVETDIDGDRVDLTEYMVTRWYRAPELVLNPGKYGKAQDIWAVGCTLSELISRAPLFPGKDTVHQLQLIIHIMGTPTAMDLNFDMPPNSRRFVENLHSNGEGFEVALSQAHAVDPNLYCLMREMLQFNPNRRVTAEEAVSDPMFAHLRKEAESEVPVPISWKTYHETLSSIQEANTNRARLRVIRKCVNCLQENLGSRVVDESLEDIGAEVEASAVQSSVCAEDDNTCRRRFDSFEVARVEDTTRASSRPFTTQYSYKRVSTANSNHSISFFDQDNAVSFRRDSSQRRPHTLLETAGVTSLTPVKSIRPIRTNDDVSQLETKPTPQRTMLPPLRSFPVQQNLMSTPTPYKTRYVSMVRNWRISSPSSGESSQQESKRPTPHLAHSELCDEVNEPPWYSQSERANGNLNTPQPITSRLLDSTNPFRTRRSLEHKFC